MSRIDDLHDTMKPGLALAAARQMTGRVTCPVCPALNPSTLPMPQMDLTRENGVVGLKCWTCGSNIVLTGHIQGINNKSDDEWAALGKVLGIEVPPMRTHRS